MIIRRNEEKLEISASWAPLTSIPADNRTLAPIPADRAPLALLGEPLALASVPAREFFYVWV